MMENYNSFMTIGDAAKYLGISIETLRDWSDDGKILTYRNDTNRRLYKITDLDAHLKSIVLEKQCENLPVT